MTDVLTRAERPTATQRAQLAYLSDQLFDDPERAEQWLPARDRGGYDTVIRALLVTDRDPAARKLEADTRLVEQMRAVRYGVPLVSPSDSFDVEAAIAGAERTLGLAADAVASDTLARHVTPVRHWVMWLAVKAGGWSYRRIASRLRRDPSTCISAVAKCQLSYEAGRIPTWVTDILSDQERREGEDRP